MNTLVHLKITFMRLWLMRVYIYIATSWLEALYSRGYGSFWDWQELIFLNIILLKKNRMEFEGRKLRSCSFVQFCLNSQSLFYHIHLHVLICYQLHNISLQGEVHYMFHQMKIHIILTMNLETCWNVRLKLKTMNTKIL